MPPLTFEDPPPPKGMPPTRSRPQYIDPFDIVTLTERTGQWALLFEGHISKCYSLSRTAKTSMGPFAGELWETAVRRNPDHDTGKLYVRHIAPQEN